MTVGRGLLDVEAQRLGIASLFGRAIQLVRLHCVGAWRASSSPSPAGRPGGVAVADGAAEGGGPPPRPRVVRSPVGNDAVGSFQPGKKIAKLPQSRRGRGGVAARELLTNGWARERIDALTEQVGKLENARMRDRSTIAAQRDTIATLQTELLRMAAGQAAA